MDEPRDYHAEALAIIAGTSLLLPERLHLTALYEWGKLKAEALNQVLEAEWTPKEPHR